MFAPVSPENDDISVNTNQYNSDDDTTHSSQQDYENEHDSDENQDQNHDVVNENNTTSTKVIQKPLWKRILPKFILFGILFLFGALATDVYLYLKMEFTAKTVDAVLSDSSPEADIKLSVDVSSRMLFTSIDVKSFECMAFHKAPYDKVGQYFATATNDNGFETNTIIQNYRDAKEHFIENMDIKLSGIDFEIMKRAIQDNYFTANQTATRLDCALNVNVNLLGFITFPWSDVKKTFEHECDDCETQGGFDNNDIFMASVVGHLISEQNTESFREGEPNHKRSVTFSENSQEFVFTVDKHFDLSSAMGNLERFKVEVPAAEYIVTSKDREEYWTTTTEPVTVDLAKEGGTYLLSDITTTCTNVITNEPCKVTDPLTNFLDDVWNGHIEYEVSSAPNAAIVDDRFKLRSNEDDTENFVEALFGFDAKLDIDMDLNFNIFDLFEDASDALDDNFGDHVEVNRKLEIDGVPNKKGSLKIHMSGEHTEFVYFELELEKGWPGHDGGLMSVLDVWMFDEEVRMSMIFNVGPRDLEFTLRDVEIPDVFTSSNKVVKVNMDWHQDDDHDQRKAWLNYVIMYGNEVTRKDTITVPYGEILDTWRDNDIALDETDWSNDDDSYDMWHCTRLSHNDKNARAILCYHKSDNRYNFTTYDDKNKKIFDIVGTADGKYDKIDFSGGVMESIHNTFANVFNANGFIRGDLTIHDRDYYDFDGLDKFRLQGSLNNNGFDVFLDFSDESGEEMFLFRALSGWKDMNAFNDMIITRNQFKLKVDGVERFGLNLHKMYVHVFDTDDIDLGLDRLSMVVDDREIFDTTFKAKYKMDNADVVSILILNDEEKTYLKMTGHFDYDTSQEWTMDMKKLIIRLDGEERVRCNMRGHMEKVDDSTNDEHAAGDMSMYLALDKEEYLNVPAIHVDVIVNGDKAREVSVATNLQGIIRGDETFNGTLFVDKVNSDWRISTNNFDVLEPLLATSAPTLSPTDYAYETKTLLEVNTNVNYHTTLDEFENDEAAQQASIDAFDKSMNQTGANTEINNMQTEFFDDGTRRRLAVVEGIKVTYRTTIIAETTGLNTTELYNKMQKSITTAVESGTFAENLEIAFEEHDVAETFTADTTVEVAPPVVTVITDSPSPMPSSMPSSMPSEEPITPFPTESPTHAPSLQPTLDTTTLSSSEDESFSTVNIIIICVVVPIGIILCAALAYFATSSRSKNLNVAPHQPLPVGLAER